MGFKPHLLPLNSVGPIPSTEFVRVWLLGIVPSVVRSPPRSLFLALGIRPSPLDPLLAKANQLNFIPLLGKDHMRFGLVLGGPFGLVVTLEPFASVRNHALGKLDTSV